MDNSKDRPVALFRRWTTFTLIFVFLVICAGAIVRATGSGMGCPDWPKCFGSWMPPTSIDQLPQDYQEKYARHGALIEEFNVYKTWTEYVNRLLGALLGLVAVVNVFMGLRIRKMIPQAFWLSMLVFVMIGFEGWLGKTVVDSNLAPLRISLHMVVALLIMLLCIYTLRLCTPEEKNENIHSLRWWIAVLLLVTIVQVVLGVKIREQVDTITLAPDSIPKSNWVEMLNAAFPIHRSFSIAVLLLNAWIWYRLRRSAAHNMANLMMILILCEVITGVVMSYLHFPPATQPLHLVLAAGLFATQSWLFSKAVKA